MYIERALDWEQCYFKAAILHPFFTNYAKINERIIFHQKCQAFSLWAYNPQRRFLSGMLRFKNHTYGNLHDFLSSWKLKAKMESYEMAVRILMRISKNQDEKNAYNLYVAFRAWAPDAWVVKVQEKLKKLLLIAIKKRTMAFLDWKENTIEVRNRYLDSVLKGHENLIVLYSKAQKLNKKLYFDVWAKQNRKNILYRLVARLVSNTVEKQKVSLGLFRDSCRRQRIVRKTFGTSKILLLKEKDNEVMAKDAWRIWKFSGDSRKKKLLKKYVVLFMNKTRIGYQQAYWRWMAATSKYEWIMIHPKHVLFLKQLAVILERWEKRMKQASLFRIAVQHSDSPDKYLRRESVQWSLGVSDNQRSSSRSLRRHNTVSIVEEHTTSQVVITGRELDVAKMSASITRMVDKLESAYIKNMIKAFDKIAELSYDSFFDSSIQEYQDDNEQLRAHNESLSESLNRSTYEYDMMAQHLDSLRLNNLFRAIGSVLTARKQESFLRMQLHR